MIKRINCGKYWTVLSTECWMRKDCSLCFYSNYCKRTLVEGTDKPVMKAVIDQLIVKFGIPPEKMIEGAKDAWMNKY